MLTINLKKPNFKQTGTSFGWEQITLLNTSTSCLFVHAWTSAWMETDTLSSRSLLHFCNVTTKCEELLQLSVSTISHILTLHNGKQKLGVFSPNVFTSLYWQSYLKLLHDRHILEFSQHESKVLFLALSATLFFVCESNISGTTERICAKFTGNTCVWSLTGTSLNVKVKGQGH